MSPHASALPTVLTLLVMSACATPDPSSDVAAVIVEPDAASRAELQAVVQTALHGATVQLASNALTETSELSIEHVKPRGIGAPPATGRLLGRPATFNLVLDGPQCVLIHQDTGLRWLLVDTHCRAE